MGGLFGCDGFSAGGDDDSFAKAIDYNEHGVGVSRFWEVGDEVHSYRFPDVGRDRVRLQRNSGSLFVLRGLADRASVDVVSGELGEAGPPVFSGDEFIGFPSAGVAYGGMVVVQFD